MSDQVLILIYMSVVFLVGVMAIKVIDSDQDE